MEKILADEKYWNKAWSGIFDHYQKDRRFSYYIESLLEPQDRLLLELGAGSFRDMSRLNSQGYDCYGIDFSDESVRMAHKVYPGIAKKIIKADGSKLPFPDNHFDLTYHNGFWVCFDDETIIKFAQEQARVSKRAMIATVHNAHNESFRSYFDKLKVKDPLYSCRFFTIEEISSLMGTVCSEVKVIPVGKAKKHYEDYLINLGLASPENLKRCWKYHNQDLLQESERLMCIGIL